MKIVNVHQRTPPWERWRAAGVTASEAAIIADCSPYKTPWRLWAEKVGLLNREEPGRKPFVKDGARDEDDVRRWFEDRHDTLLLPVCGEYDAEPVIRASFDGLTEACEDAPHGEPVELKCPTAKVFAEVKADAEQSTAYRLYWHQVQHQMLVADAAAGWLVFHHDGEAIEFRIDRDQDYLAEHVTRCLEFRDAVTHRNEPRRDPARDIFVPAGEASDAWQTFAAQFRAEHATMKGWEARVAESRQRLAHLEAELLALMGEFAVAEACGLRVTRFIKQGVVDWKAVAKQVIGPGFDEAAYEDFRRKASTQTRVTLVEEQTANVPFDKAQMEALARSEGEQFYF